MSLNKIAEKIFICILGIMSLNKIAEKIENPNINPFKPDRISDSCQLDQSISNLRVVGLHFLLPSKF